MYTHILGFVSISIIFFVITLFLRKRQKIDAHMTNDQCVLQNFSKDSYSLYNPGNECFIFENDTCYRGVVDDNLKCIKKYSNEIVFFTCLSILCLLIAVVFIFSSHK